MKFIVLLLSVISLYGASEFSINRADYVSEFSIEFTQVKAVKETTVIKKSRIPTKKQVVKKSSSKQKLNGYERAKKTYGNKVVIVNSKKEAKALLNKRKNLKPIEKLKLVLVNKTLTYKFEKADFIIMIPAKTRADKEVLYTIYFFKTA